jgi:glutamate-1-semialdehyde 2,1-aminomutase
MAAGLAMLRHLNAHHGIYGALNEIGRKISEGIKKINIELGYSYTVNHLGSMYSLFFSDEPVIDFESAKKSNTALFGKYFQAMLKRGVYLAPSQFESLFLSTALTDDLIQKILDAHRESMLEIHS